MFAHYHKINHFEENHREQQMIVYWKKLESDLFSRQQNNNEREWTETFCDTLRRLKMTTLKYVPFCRLKGTLGRV